MAGLVRRTPVMSVEGAALGVAAPLLLKLELLQHTGSFKARGALNRLLVARESGELSPTGVVAASGGNHGLGVAWAAGTLGVPAEIFVPEATSPAKRARLAASGARVVVGGAFYADAYAAAVTQAESSGALLVQAYDDPHVVSGQGTCGLELGEQAAAWAPGGLDTVLVAVGGGGFAAGVAAGLAAAGSRARVVGVEPELIPTWHAARAAGAPVDVPVGGVASDSLGARRLGDVPFAVLRDAGAGSVLVADDAILAARRALWDRLRLVAEPGGATAAAALLCGAYRPAPGERVAVVVCGGNTDPSDLA